MISRQKPKTKNDSYHSYASYYGNMFVQLLLLLVLAFIIRTFFYGLYQVPTGSMEPTMLVGERFLADKLSYWFRKPQRGEIIAFNDPLFNYSSNPIKNWLERYVWGPSNWTKRVIGIPGDRVKGVIEDGKPVVYVNEKKLDESYLNPYPLIMVWRTKPSSLFDDTARIDPRTYDPSKPYDQQPFYRINPDLLLKINNTPQLRYPHTPSEGGVDLFDVVLKDNQYWVMGDNRKGSNDSRSWQALDGKLIHGRILYRLWSSDSTEDWWIVDLIKHPIDFWKRMRWSRFLQRVR